MQSVANRILRRITDEVVDYDIEDYDDKTNENKIKKSSFKHTQLQLQKSK
jgi:hypothetical protein